MATKKKKTGPGMRLGNSGLTVKINLWSMGKLLRRFDSRRAKLFIRGQVTRDDEKHVIFNGPGELLSILGSWNAQKFRELKRKARMKAKGKPTLKLSAAKQS
jgi:hypothetical protein